MMTDEVLKDVWICRPALQAFLGQVDPTLTGSVSVDQFRAGIVEVSRQLRMQGRSGIADAQIDSICAVASKGTSHVAYTELLKGLHVVDTGLRCRSWTGYDREESSLPG